MPVTNQNKRANAEVLESRILLAMANIHVTDAYLTDSTLNRLAAPPVVGQEYGIRVDFTTADLPVTARYKIQYEVDAIVLSSPDLSAGAGAPSANSTNASEVGFVASGEHQVRITVDWEDRVAESDETDNVIEFTVSPASPVLPQKMVTPIAGTQGVDWFPTAYVDLDPSDGRTDYRGRQYAYDGSKGLNFAVPFYDSMDRGIDIKAAIPGTVVEVHDGEYDRYYDIISPAPKDNYVIVDHGGGWRTRYGRLRTGSVAVTPGQVLTAGQKVGLLGGSGNATPNYLENGAFLRFELLHNGDHVEPFLDADAYWVSAPDFAGDVPAVDRISVSPLREPPTDEFLEGFARRHVFHPGETAYVYTSWHGANRERVRQYIYTRPDGTQVGDAPNTYETDAAQITRFGFYEIGAGDPLGTWEVAMMLDGEELARESFVVANRSEGLPEIKVMQGADYVINGRTTPIDFGRVNQSAATPRRVFNVKNYGTKTLTLSQITLPDGYSVVGTSPATVAAGAVRPLTVQLETRVGGSKTGTITIRSDDVDDSEIRFAVKGFVNPLPPAVVGRYVFYDGSALDTGGDTGDDAVIATDKQGLLPGQTPTFANVTSYTGGINGIMIDVARLPATAEVGPGAFNISIPGPAAAAAPVASSLHSSDVPKPDVTLRRGAGVNGSDRITLTWDGSPFRNMWLSVSILPGPLGLDTGGEFMFGNLVGDVDGTLRVNALDLAAVKKNLNLDAPITSRYDFNRDGRINALDVAALKQNLGRFLSAAPAPIPVASPFATTSTPLALQRARDEDLRDELFA